MNIRRWVALGFALMISMISVAQSIPHQISHQGKLMENDQPVDGIKSMIFTIGTWSETQSVEIVDGIYTVELGANRPIPAEVFSVSNSTLQLSIDGTTFPATEILSVPYAYQAEQAQSVESVSWNQITEIPADLADGDAVGIATESDPVFTNHVAYGVTAPHISNWDAAYGWNDHSSAGYLTSEADPTVLASVKNGVDWSELSGIPADLTNGDDVGITSETDPVFLASAAHDFTQADVDNLKAGKLNNGTMPWTDAGSLTAGNLPNARLDVDVQDLADGSLSASKVQYGGYFIPSVGSNGQVWKSDGSGAGYWGTDATGGTESDPQVGANTANYISKWNGSALISSTVYDDGNVGIGTTSPGTKLEVNGSTAFGAIVSAVGLNAHAAGYNAHASGNYSHAEGYGATASGTASHAEGYNVTASGSQSHVEGFGNTALGYSTHAAGRMAKAIHDIAYIWNDGSNVDGDNYFKSTANQQFSVHAANGIRLYGGNVYYQGSLVDESDLRLKQNIQPIQDALDKVKQIRGVYFEMIRKPEVTEVGVIAQEVEAVLPEVVVDNPEGYKSVDYSKITALLIEAIKELNAKNEVLEREIEILMQR